MAKKSERWQLAVQYAGRPACLPAKREVRRWIRAALPAKGKTGGRITVRFVDAEEGLRLNSSYRGKERATNVLSFSYEVRPRICGDLVLCAPVVEREASEQGKSLSAHYAHLIVHGLLHLQAYDHEADERQAAEMEAEERRILAALGYPDPYRDEG